MRLNYCTGLLGQAESVAAGRHREYAHSLDDCRHKLAIFKKNHVMIHSKEEAFKAERLYLYNKETSKI